MLPQEIIRKKRDNKVLTTEEIREFIQGVTSEKISGEQIAAFCMAVYFNDLNLQERTALTLSMRDSGDCLRWQLNGPVLDKHSTGGVGDVVSLMLAPLLAACGAYVPMISGRGLGHTGGTLDKLESIPGFGMYPSPEKLHAIVSEVGCAIIGQTSNLAPADRRIYATRDVTATVESIALITTSILSKKLAEGLDALVMDVKTGSGAFMPTYELSQALAQSIATVATAAGCPTTALITDMNQVLAASAGNAVEVMESIEFLRGDIKSPRLKEVTFALGAQALVSGKLAKDSADALQQLENALSSGKAAELFNRMSAAQGGPADIMENPDNYLPKAAIIKPVTAGTNGVIQQMDTRAIGIAVIQLGGGRTRVEDKIDHRVGFSDILPLGSQVSAETPIAVIHAQTESAWAQAAQAYRAALHISDVGTVAECPAIYDTITV